ncbi:response regulator, partial [filamentous cyanobacterium LEGE 11480]
AKMLEQFGYQADIVGNGKAALAALDRAHYDVILMDIQMPEMDGITATQNIRANPTITDQPWIIAVTAHAMRGAKEEYIKQGMNDYMTKPIQKPTLIEILATARAQHALKQTAQDAITPTSDAQTTDASIGHETPPTNTDATVDSGISAPLNHRQTNAVPPPIFEHHFDQTILQELQVMLGEETIEMLLELFQNYLEDTPNTVTQIRTAIEQQSASQLKAAAHALRSCSINLGAAPLSQLCQTLEDMGQQQTLNGAEVTFAAVLQEYQQVCSIMQNTTAENFPMTISLT